MAMTACASDLDFKIGTLLNVRLQNFSAGVYTDKLFDGLGKRAFGILSVRNVMASVPQKPLASDMVFGPLTLPTMARVA
jgi:hypothetical protein